MSLSRFISDVYCKETIEQQEELRQLIDYLFNETKYIPNTQFVVFVLFFVAPLITNVFPVSEALGSGMNALMLITITIFFI